MPVFEVGQDGEVGYYAMQFIQGQGLDQVIEELRRLRGDPARPAPPARPGGTGGRSPGPRPWPAPGRRRRPGGPVAPDRPVRGRRRSTARPRRPAAAGPIAGRDRRPDRRPGDRDRPDRGRGPSAPTRRPSARLGGAAGRDASSRASSRAAGSRSTGASPASASRRPQALAYAHARGIVHRDIKPSNLLLDTAGVVWVTDFGLAKAEDDGLTSTGDILGTLRYMAPERFRGEGDGRADIYALGLTLYELLTLRPAFDSTDRLRLIEQVKAEEPARPRSLDPRIPRDLETIVLKAIDKDPERRYQTAEELAEDLRRFLADEPIQARRVGLWERAVLWARRRPAEAALAAVGSLAAVAR